MQGTKGYGRLSPYAWKTIVQFMHKILDDVVKEIEAGPSEEIIIEEDISLQARKKGVDVRKEWNKK